MRRTSPPRITLSNRQKTLRLNLPAVRRIVRQAWQRIPALDSRLSTLDSLSIAFVTDAEIAQLNEQFVRHHGPTDVITFQHGEIVISTDRAVAQSRRFQTTPYEELALYLIHGLLHLGGYDDTTPAKRRIMGRRQRALLRTIRNKLDLRALLR